MVQTSDTEVKPKKRAVRKRAPAKTAAAKAAASSPVKKPAPRKRATPKKAVDKKETAVAQRKAPTPLADESKAKKSFRTRIIISLIIISFGIAGSAAVGFTDKGAIDVTQTIATRNELNKSSGSGEAVVPVQNNSLEPDGGLKGFGIGTQTPAPVTESEEITEEESAGAIPLTAAEAAAQSAGGTDAQASTTPGT